jgi:hypothetical protein
MKYQPYLAALMLLSACSESRRPPIGGTSLVLQVTLSSEGRVTANGMGVTIQDLNTELRKLAARGGTVWYYRETGSGEIPTESLEILQAIVACKLPVRFSQQPDFSDFPGST